MRLREFLKWLRERTAQTLPIRVSQFKLRPWKIFLHVFSSLCWKCWIYSCLNESVVIDTHVNRLWVYIFRLIKHVPLVFRERRGMMTFQLHLEGRRLDIFWISLIFPNEKLIQFSCWFLLSDEAKRGWPLLIKVELFNFAIRNLAIARSKSSEAMFFKQTNEWW